MAVTADPKPELIADHKAPGAGITGGGLVAPRACFDCEQTISPEDGYVHDLLRDVIICEACDAQV